VTYCLALRLDEGLLFMSDTRTNAGVDNVSTFRKLHVLRPREDRAFVLQSAGNLATTHEVLDRIDRDLAGEGENLATVSRLFEAALYIGGIGQQVVASHRAALGDAASATFIFGGQIAGERPEIYLLYPEGNYIRASDTVPFLQIGEAKYGKFFLELAVRAHVDLALAGKIALSAMMSTARANLSVGPPYDAAVYLNGSLEMQEVRIEATSPYLTELADVWSEELLQAIHALPPIPDELRVL
jgi:putative proteasome-type protease